MTSEQKPVIGFSCGDLNGIGLELIIKTLSDTRLTEICTPVVFASNKAINFYKKSVTDGNFSYQAIRDFQRLSPKTVNVFSCWEEEVSIQPGQLTETGGTYAIRCTVTDNSSTSCSVTPNTSIMELEEQVQAFWYVVFCIAC